MNAWMSVVLQLTPLIIRCMFHNYCEKMSKSFENNCSISIQSPHSDFFLKNLLLDIAKFECNCKNDSRNENNSFDYMFRNTFYKWMKLVSIFRCAFIPVSGCEDCTKILLMPVFSFIYLFIHYKNKLRLIVLGF
jgi:hypothetical protein